MPLMAKIVQQEAKVLRATAKPVPLKEIGTPAIKKIIKDLSAALAKEEDGVAIAAPQIGESRRIFVVSGKMLTAPDGTPGPDLVFINPVITSRSKKKVKMEEGCLSVRWLYGHVERAQKVTVEAYDETGKKFTRHGSGLWAQIFQHEIDHLDGILFIDKAQNLMEIKPEHVK